MNRVLVTGASGFVGRALCARLRAQGVAVTALMRRAPDAAGSPWDRALACDLTQGPPPAAALAGCAAVFHLAGLAHAVAGPQALPAYRLAHVTATAHLLTAAAAAGVGRLVYFSSIKAGGEGGALPQDETAPARPQTPYGISKLEAEALVLGPGGPPHAVVLRPSLIYGPHPKGYLALMIRALRAGWFPRLPETGARRSMIHLDDVLDAALLVATDPRAAGRCYILEDGAPVTSAELEALIRAALGRRPARWRTPTAVLRAAGGAGDLLARLTGRRLPFDSEVCDKLLGPALFDGARIRRELGFNPRRRLADSLPAIVASVP